MTPQFKVGDIVRFNLKEADEAYGPQMITEIHGDVFKVVDYPSMKNKGKTSPLSVHYDKKENIKRFYEAVQRG